MAEDERLDTVGRNGGKSGRMGDDDMGDLFGKPLRQRHGERVDRKGKTIEYDKPILRLNLI
jgi:hypothetical protein